MNFFEHQAKARRQSRRIVIAFIAVAILTIVAVNFIVLAAIGFAGPVAQGVSAITHTGIPAWLSWDFLTSNIQAIGLSTALTGGVIGLSSLGKVASLKSGGGKVASSLGGVLVTPDTRDPLRRRLYNVVEEISLASGVPVPEVYVMDNEPGINAFAAGYNSSDAVVAVTRGTLEKLSRSELQGVIAHEFSHILNGDMRLNIRMMGLIFGILVISIIGRKFLHSTRYSSSNKRDGVSAVVAVGMALVLVGYIGLFFSRWMKSAVSRQREYLADASAVQFTREPEGIGGALKKIAAYQHSSYLNTDPEEISHMLFSKGYRSFMFATHPPIEERIKRIERDFNAEDIENLAEKLREAERREHEQAEQASKEQAEPSKGKLLGGILDVDTMIDNIGNPDMERILAAAIFADALDQDLRSAAHSLEWSPEVLFYCLLNDTSKIRNKQLKIIQEQMGDISESKVSHLLTSHKKVKPQMRLPLLEIAFPGIKRRPKVEIEKILRTANDLIHVDNQVEPFEYLLVALLEMYLEEVSNPSIVKPHGKKTIVGLEQSVSDLLSSLVSQGYDMTQPSEIQQAQKAYVVAMKELAIGHTNLQFNHDWQQRLTSALSVLNELSPSEKSKLISAMSKAVMHDGKLLSKEHELLRAICAKIHVPLPFLQKTNT